jgi:hypothetical protein
MSKTFQYFSLKKFFKLLLVALVPAILLAWKFSLNSMSDFIVNYKSMNLSSFNAIFNVVSEFQFKQIPAYIVIFAVFLVCLTEIIGAVERDMRVGNFTLRNFFRRFNNNFIAVSFTLMYFMISILVMAVAAAAFFFLWAVIAGQIASLILSIFTIIILFCLLGISWAFFFLLVPNMIITGQSLIACLRDSVRQTRGIFIQLVIAIILPLLPAFGLIYLERALHLELAFLLDVLINAALIVYYPTLMLVIYYEVMGLAREDLNPQNRYFR